MGQLKDLLVIMVRGVNIVSAVWLDTYGDYGECSLTCGGGVQIRQQLCSHGDTCPGIPGTEERECNTQECPREFMAACLKV